jgi:hypothetical protein
MADDRIFSELRICVLCPGDPGGQVHLSGSEPGTRRDMVSPFIAARLKKNNTDQIHYEFDNGRRHY